MHWHLEHAESAAEMLDDTLQAETYAEHRDPPRDQQFQRLANCKILRPSRPRRQHHQIRPQTVAELLPREIVAQRRDLRSGRADVAGERMHERIFVIDQEQLAAAPDRRAYLGPHRGPALALDRAEQGR